MLTRLNPLSEDQAYLFETDVSAVKVYLIKMTLLSLLCIGIATGLCIYLFHVFYGHLDVEKEFQTALMGLGLILVVILVLIWVFSYRYFLDSDVLVASDFISGPSTIDWFSCFKGVLKHRFAMPFSAINRVVFSVHKDRVVSIHLIVATSPFSIRCSFLKSSEEVLKILLEKEAVPT